MALEPPPAEDFTSSEEAIQSTKDWAQNRGFAIRILRSKPDKHKVTRKYWLCCDRGTAHKSQAFQRTTASRRIECPFSITITRCAETGIWARKCENPEHNHQSSDHPQSHPSYRQLTEEQKHIANQLSAANARPKDVITHLRNLDPSTHITLQEIYNQRSANKRDKLGGLTPIEALIKQLEGPEWACDYTTDDTGHVNELFFAYDPAIKLARTYPEVVLIDATYRTNRYNMPLLHFMGVTPLGTSFSSAFCFMAAENEIQYAKAIASFIRAIYGTSSDVKIKVFLTDDESELKKALSRQLPEITQLLCVWHINKNVEKKAQDVWRRENVSNEKNERNQELKEEFMAAWNKVIRANTEDEFEAEYADFQSTYKDQQNLISYIHRNKYPKRHQFIRAWTSKHAHYGNIATSRCEGGHQKLKDHLQNNKHDLLDIISKVKQLTDIFINEYRMVHSRARIRVPYDVSATSIKIFKQGINNEVVPRALRMVVEQFKLLKTYLHEESPPPCTRSLRQVHGVPCWHELHHIRALKLQLDASHFNSFHHFARLEQTGFLRIPTPPPAPEPVIFAPHVVARVRGRKHKDNSTRRDPSQWELEDIRIRQSQRPGHVGGSFSAVSHH